MTDETGILYKFVATVFAASCTGFTAMWVAWKQDRESKRKDFTNLQTDNDQLVSALELRDKEREALWKENSELRAHSLLLKQCPYLRCPLRVKGVCHIETKPHEHHQTEGGPHP